MDKAGLPVVKPPGEPERLEAGVTILTIQRDAAEFIVIHPMDDLTAGDIDDEALVAPGNQNGFSNAASAKGPAPITVTAAEAAAPIAAPFTVFTAKFSSASPGLSTDASHAAAAAGAPTRGIAANPRSVLNSSSKTSSLCVAEYTFGSQ